MRPRSTTAGMVVGYSDSSGTGNPTRAFLYTQSGGMQDLGTLGGSQSYAWYVNKSGQIVGYSQVAHGTYHGFLWPEAPAMVDLGPYQAMLINNAGLVVATSGSFHPSKRTFPAAGPANGRTSRAGRHGDTTAWNEQFG